LQENQMMKYRVLLEPDLEAGGYVVSCPALPGCHSQGETREEALANIRDAIEGVLASLKSRNLPLPSEEEVEVRMP
jgi:antitoxin HicB